MSGWQYSFRWHPKHRDLLKVWHEEHGNRVGFSCEQMTETDRAISRDSMLSLYKIARLEPPPPERVVFASSPFVAAVASGIAATIWWMRESGVQSTDEIARFSSQAGHLTDIYRRIDWNVATSAYFATRDQIEMNTKNEVVRIVRAKSPPSSLQEFYESYHIQKDIGGYADTIIELYRKSAVLAAQATVHEDGKTERSEAETALLREFENVQGYSSSFSDLLTQIAVNTGPMWSDGNEGANDASYISFFRDVAKFRASQYVAYRFHELLTRHSGIRLVHEKFTIISDRPEYMYTNERGRGDCESGPYKRYRDGYSVYRIRDVLVNRKTVENPKSLTPKEISSTVNVEARRIMIERYGAELYLQKSRAVCVSEDRFGKLWLLTQGLDEPLVMVECLNSTPEPDGSVKTYWLRVHPELRPRLAGDWGKPQTLTPRNAIASTFGLYGSHYEPEVMT